MSLPWAAASPCPMGHLSGHLSLLVYKMKGLSMFRERTTRAPATIKPCEEPVTPTATPLPVLQSAGLLFYFAYHSLMLDVRGFSHSGCCTWLVVPLSPPFLASLDLAWQ